MHKELDADILNRAEIDFSDLEVSPEDKHLVGNLMRRVALKAPSQAKIKFTLSKSKGFYSSTLVIQSLQGLFDSSVIGETLEESLEFLHEDIISKLNIWKQSRFLDKEAFQTA